MCPTVTPGPKRCSTDSAVSNTYDSVTFERPCVPPKTHRIWNGGQAPDRLPMSFRRYAWPFKSYRGVKIQLFTFTLHLLGPGVSSLCAETGSRCNVSVRGCWDGAHSSKGGSGRDMVSTYHMQKARVQKFHTVAYGGQTVSEVSGSVV